MNVFAILFSNSAFFLHYSKGMIRPYVDVKGKKDYKKDGKKDCTKGGRKD